MRFREYGVYRVYVEFRVEVFGLDIVLSGFGLRALLKVQGSIQGLRVPYTFMDPDGLNLQHSHHLPHNTVSNPE